MSEASNASGLSTPSQKIESDSDSGWHPLDHNHREMWLRMVLEPWTWTWVTVDEGQGVYVQLALWSGVRFLSANGQLPIAVNVVAYRRVIFPSPFDSTELDSA